jgi:hypothetical protein
LGAEIVPKDPVDEPGGARGIEHACCLNRLMDHSVSRDAIQMPELIDRKPESGQQGRVDGVEWPLAARLQARVELCAPSAHSRRQFQEEASVTVVREATAGPVHFGTERGAAALDSHEHARGEDADAGH